MSIKEISTVAGKTITVDTSIEALEKVTDLRPGDPVEIIAKCHLKGSTAIVEGVASLCVCGNPDCENQKTTALWISIEDGALFVKFQEINSTIKKSPPT